MYIYAYQYFWPRRSATFPQKSECAFSAVQLKNAESLVYRETHSKVLQTLFKENNLFVGTVYNDCLVTPNNVHLSKQSFYTLTNSDNNFISFVNSFSGIQSNVP